MLNIPQLSVDNVVSTDHILLKIVKTLKCEVEEWSPFMEDRSKGVLPPHVYCEKSRVGKNVQLATNPNLVFLEPLHCSYWRKHYKGIVTSTNRTYVRHVMTVLLGQTHMDLVRQE